MITEARDASRSFEEWLKLDKTALVLKCNAYNINATGKKAVLIDRLMRHFDRDEINLRPGRIEPRRIFILPLVERGER